MPSDDRVERALAALAGPASVFRSAVVAAAEEVRGFLASHAAPENGAGPTAPECASAESDPESFYSTQAVTEDLAFTKGRELVEGM